MTTNITKPTLTESGDFLLYISPTSTDPKDGWQTLKIPRYKMILWKIQHLWHRLNGRSPAT